MTSDPDVPVTIDPSRGHTSILMPVVVYRRGARVPFLSAYHLAEQWVRVWSVDEHGVRPPVLRTLRGDITVKWDRELLARLAPHKVENWKEHQRADPTDPDYRGFDVVIREDDA